ncbi:class III signal peptide-containing protein [Thermococcus sp. M39]|uniref:class III signal peptide-containing protein n=1 Tax=unclassified Thermococcus TaxID=2627626 RepID=UPI00143BF044|nr:MULTISPECIES: class III signal peptide-containing protein [unclassified Thermococcus]NJE07281.1 class III signal peptide-containing protein [Thermococcus sp. M39]NJE12587.1 class III signal peptide-containing protein [Thermococcus sp. LS2]
MRGQAAIEYLFMILVALLLVSLVLKYTKSIAENTGKTIENATRLLIREIQKSYSEIGK